MAIGLTHDLLYYNKRPVHFIKNALWKCFRGRANFRRWGRHKTGASLKIKRKTTKNKEKIPEFNFKAAKNEEYFLISN
jgi:hypothetical protein